MELKDFISSTLVETAKGIKDAQAEYEKLGGAVNPVNLVQERGMYFVEYKPGGIRDGRFYLNTVEYDIGLTNDENSKVKGGIGVFLSAINLGTDSTESTCISSVTRIRFSVSVKLPTAAYHGG